MDGVSTMIFDDAKQGAKGLVYTLRIRELPGDFGVQNDDIGALSIPHHR